MPVLPLPARFPLRSLIALLLGILHATSFMNDAAWPLQIAALTGLFLLILRAVDGIHSAESSCPNWRSLRRILLKTMMPGFAFGLGWLLTGISWIFISLHTYGEMNPLIAGAATFALCAYLSIYPALAGGLAAAWIARCQLNLSSNLLAISALFAAFWALGELGRGLVFTGFPWLASGYAHVGGPLSGYAALLGVYGIGLIAAFMAALIAGLITTHIAKMGGRRLRPLLILIALPLIGFGLGRVHWTQAVSTPLHVRLLQGNIAQDIKFIESRFDETAAVYMQLIEQKPSTPLDLIVLPETAFPRFLDELPPSLMKRLQDDSTRMNASIAFGVPIEESGARYFNSVLAITPDNDLNPGSSAPLTTAPQRYNKFHLVPFGEFIPYGFHWFVRLMHMPLGDFTRGEALQKPMSLALANIAFNICYEDLFGEQIRQQARYANILINVSNVAWFGDSLALPQHLQISRMRALETGKPMLRSTNTGMTASIDPQGRVLAQLAPFAVGALDVKVQGMTGQTPYVRIGDWGVALLAVVLLMGVLMQGRIVHAERKK